MSMTACGGGAGLRGGASRTQDVPEVASGLRVAAYGATEAALLKTISDATAAGDIPVFIEIRTSHHAYDFSPWAHIYRTASTVIAVALQSKYVWPIGNVSVEYVGSGPIGIDSLPLVQSPQTDKSIARMIKNARTMAPEGTALASCSDCVAIFKKRKLPAGLPRNPDPEDMWQRTQHFSAWTDEAIPRTVAMDVPTNTPSIDTSSMATEHKMLPMYTNYGYSCPSGWTCYYGGNFGGDYYYSGTGGGGGGGQPNVQQQCAVPANVAQGSATYNAIADTPAIQNTLVALSNDGYLPTVNVVSGAKTAPAPDGITTMNVEGSYSAATNTITLYPDEITALGGSYSSVLLHEVLHAYFELPIFSSAGQSVPLLTYSNVGVASVAISGTTYTFNTNLISAGGGNETIGQGYVAYEHMAIHDIEVENGFTDSSSLWEGLDGSSHPASTTAATMTTVAKKNSQTDIELPAQPIVPSNETCKELVASVLPNVHVEDIGAGTYVRPSFTVYDGLPND